MPNFEQRAEAKALQWQTRNYPAFFLMRAESPANPWQEFLMENLFFNYFNGTLVKARFEEVRMRKMYKGWKNR